MISSAFDICKALKTNPEEHINDFDLSLLAGWDWCLVLLAHPRLSELCEWDKLNGWNWRCLLAQQPQFADKCAWDKLKDWDWDLLVYEQPNILDHLSEEERARAVMLSEYALLHINNPSNELIRLHKVKHEL